MRPEQKIVAIGAASGIAAMLLAVWLLTKALPSPRLADEVGARLAYALGANVFALVPFFVMLITVGNSRFLSDAMSTFLIYQKDWKKRRWGVASNQTAQFAEDVDR